MKARYLRDKREPRKDIIESHKEELIEKGGTWYWPAGTIEDHPCAYKLVRMGDAEPADDECTLAASMTTAQKETAQRRSAALDKGILPKDYQRFFDGELAGYDIDGNDIPGPNFVPDYSDSVLELPTDL